MKSHAVPGYGIDTDNLVEAQRQKHATGNLHDFLSMS